jgi:allantoicase
VIVRLGSPGRLDRIEIDTTHFKGNYPDRFSVDASLSVSGTETDSSSEWVRILDETKLDPDRRHVFVEVLQRGPFSHVRLNIYPDGGVARFRVFGRPSP